MATIKNLEDLEAWQEARKLCAGIYKITKKFPESEKYNEMVTKLFRREISVFQARRGRRVKRLEAQ